MTIRQSSLERLGNFKVMIDDTTDRILGLVDAHGQERQLVTSATGPGGGNRLLAGNLPADMAQLSNVVVAGGLLQSWTANGIDYVATYSSGKVAAVTASDGWVQTYAWAGDVPTITVAKG